MKQEEKVKTVESDTGDRLHIVIDEDHSRLYPFTTYCGSNHYDKNPKNREVENIDKSRVCKRCSRRIENEL